MRQLDQHFLFCRIRDDTQGLDRFGHISVKLLHRIFDTAVRLRKRHYLITILRMIDYVLYHLSHTFFLLGWHIGECSEKRHGDLLLKDIHSKRLTHAVSSGIIKDIILYLEGKTESHGITLCSLLVFRTCIHGNRRRNTRSLEKRCCLVVYDPELIILVVIALVSVRQLEHLALGKVAESLGEEPYDPHVSVRSIKDKLHSLYKPVIAHQH